jgi:hypothetical protein
MNIYIIVIINYFINIWFIYLYNYRKSYFFSLITIFNIKKNIYIKMNLLFNFFFINFINLIIKSFFIIIYIFN